MSESHRGAWHGRAPQRRWQWQLKPRGIFHNFLVSAQICIAQSTVHKTGCVFSVCAFWGVCGCGRGSGGVDLLRKGDQRGERVKFIEYGKSKQSPTWRVLFNWNYQWKRERQFVPQTPRWVWKPSPGRVMLDASRSTRAPFKFLFLSIYAGPGIVLPWQGFKTPLSCRSFSIFLLSGC